MREFSKPIAYNKIQVVFSSKKMPRLHTFPSYAQAIDIGFGDDFSQNQTWLQHIAVHNSGKMLPGQLLNPLCKAGDES